MENDKPVLIYATFPDAAAAEASGSALVEEGLAACVNIIPGMVSVYRWQGVIERANEAIMIVKTARDQAGAAMSAIRSGHSYANPAILLLPVEGGSADFLAWITANTGSRR